MPEKTTHIAPRPITTNLLRELEIPTIEAKEFMNACDKESALLKEFEDLIKRMEMARIPVYYFIPPNSYIES